MQLVDVLRYDWAHTFLADSLVGQEMWCLIAAAKREGLFGEQAIYDFLSQPWCFPGSTREAKGTKWNQLQAIFDEWRRGKHEEKGTIKASMSELLGLYGMLRHFVDLRTSDLARMSEEVYLFRLTCRAVDLVLAAKKRRMPVRDAGEQLLAVLEEHMQLRVKLHGNRLGFAEEPLGF